VKKFQFSLDRVRDWREKQAAMEEAKLQALQTELGRIAERRASLDLECDENERVVIRADHTDALSLRALDDFRRSIRGLRTKLDGERQQCEQRVQSQRERVIDAQRNARLLQNLKARELTIWHADFDKEVEEQTAESYLTARNAQKRKARNGSGLKESAG
jgi:hypothetical protein